MDKPYNIGLDIGSHSIGWTVVDDNSKLVRIKGKLGYGVRLFDEGKTAEERRQFRTTRRRLKRRKWRLRLLHEIFEPHIAPLDETFFLRQKQSNLVPTQKKLPQLSLFNDRSDAEFYHKYPTIYHLRNALMTEKRQFDLREIYLAIHHIVKYRGHFLNAAPAASFKSGKFDLENKFDQLNLLFASAYSDLDFTLRTDNVDQVKAILLNEDLSASTRQRQALPLIYQTSANQKAAKKLTKSLATELLKAILGLKAKFDVLTGIETDDTKAWRLTFNAEDFDDKLNELNVTDNEAAMQIIEILRELYSSILLAAIVPENCTLSQAMMAKYNAHKQHLSLLRQVKTTLPAKKQKELQAAYDDYIDQHLPLDKFYAKLTKILPKEKETDNPQIIQILNLIDLDQLLPKQRTKDNGAIPHQLHQQELDQIIDNQKAYYPWLAQLNPNEKRQKVAKYKLDELVAFRVPYYIGPLIEAKTQQKTSGANFAWMIRKEPGTTTPITPWNFDEQVDRQASANEFIKRMTTTDTYLLGEDVLPKHSLLYQRFEVLNELNGIKIDQKRVTVRQKQAIFNDLFLKQPNITVKKLQQYLQAKGEYASAPIITGLSDPKKFNSQLSTYHEYKKIFGGLIDDPDKQADFEKCIEWSTIFEDSQILKDKLKEINWLTPEQRHKVANKRYQGWGRLSKKLLTQLVDYNGQRIIDILWNTTDNFMQIVHSEAFDKAIIKENQALLTQYNPQAVIDDLYTSPQNKKALRQILLVVNDIQKALKGQAPSRILIEFAREDQENPRLSTQRKQQVENAYKEASDALLSSAEVRQELKGLDNKAFANTRLFLYFMQGGRDIYTGKSLNIDDLSKYDIDHILPQAFIKDNSLDNRVLVSAKMNRSKSDQVPLNDFAEICYGKQMRQQWEKMLRAGLITRKKYHNLTLNPESINKYTAKGFINRQLVETRQVTKLATNLLVDQYAEDDVQLITVKSNLTHQMREEFDFPKNRNVNNHHHAFDAYLTAFVGLYLLKRYPKLAPYFVYGDYQKGASQNSKWRNFNFLGNLHREKVVDKNTGEIIWQRDAGLGELNRIYNFKKILVTRALRVNRGPMFKQTIYKAEEDKSSGRGSKQLIPTKKNRPTELYGGYTNKETAYLCLVKEPHKKGDIYRICSVLNMWLTELDRIADPIAKAQKLTELLTPQFTTTKKKQGQKIPVVKPFKVVIPKILINQRFFSRGQELSIGSAIYMHNEQELFLTKKAIYLLNGQLADNEAHELAPKIYQQILDQVNHYFPLYDTLKSREKLNNGKCTFINSPWRDKRENKKISQTGQKSILNKILVGLHANAARIKLSELNFKSDFGLLVQNPTITFSPDDQIIYQSPTGLFERRVTLKEL